MLLTGFKTNNVIYLKNTLSFWAIFIYWKRDIWSPIYTMGCSMHSEAGHGVEKTPHDYTMVLGHGVQQWSLNIYGGRMDLDNKKSENCTLGAVTLSSAKMNCEINICIFFKTSSILIVQFILFISYLYTSIVCTSGYGIDHFWSLVASHYSVHIIR